MTHDETYAYLSGLLDGEGCFSIQKSGGSYRTTIQIQMTNRAVPKWAHETFGGMFGRREATGTTEENYIWILASKPVIARLIPNLLPYLKVKQLPAMILLEFCRKFNIGRGGDYSSTQYAEMALYHDLIMRANSKGPGSNNVKDKLFQVLTGDKTNA